MNIKNRAFKAIVAIVALAALTITFASLRVTQHSTMSSALGTFTIETQQAHAGSSPFMYGQCKAFGEWTSLSSINGVDGKNWTPEYYREVGAVFVGATACTVETGDVYVLCRQSGVGGPLTWVKVGGTTPMAF